MAESKPRSGFTQPRTGRKSDLPFSGMGRITKKNRPPSIIQGVLAENVVKLRDEVYANLPHATARNKALAKDAGTTLSQVQRVAGAQLACGIDMLEALAHPLRVRPHDLITPYFAHNRTLTDPQLLRPPTKPQGRSKKH